MARWGYGDALTGRAWVESQGILLDPSGARMTTSSVVAPEYARFVADLRRADRLGPPPEGLAEGNVVDRVHVDPGSASLLMRTAALRAAGIYWKSSRDTIVWAEGGRELAIVVSRLEVETGHGLLVVHLPVRCDQVGDDVVTVTFAVGSEDRPAGLYAAAESRPRGPAAVVDAWSEALVAFAWQCLLGLLTGLTGAVGKDERGNLLVPVELSANADGLFVTPMARHRFSGTSGFSRSSGRRR
jgi:hypothetical protein